MSDRNARRQLHRPLHVRQRLLRPFLHEVNRAQIAVRSGVVRIEPQHLLDLAARLRQSAKRDQRHAIIQMRRDQTRIGLRDRLQLP